jgi:hypothetical protein
VGDRASSTTSAYSVTAGSGTDTVGLPAARYSLNLIGLTAAVSRFIRKGRMQQSKAER